MWDKLGGVNMAIINKIDDKLDIIVLAGQSNAEGSGVGDVENPYTPCEEIKMLCGDFSAIVRQVEYGNDYLDLKVENDYYLKTAEERVVDGKTYGNFALSFSCEYLKNDLPNDRKILIVNTPVGGTGFSKGHWGKGDILYNRMMDMVKEALAMNPDNRLVAFLWHQGEHDAFENAQFTIEEREEYYYGKFSELLTEFRGAFGKEVPVVCAKFCKVWADAYAEQCEAVYRATERACKEYGKAVVLDTYDLTNSDQVTGNGDTVHFSRPALYELGKRYYKAYKDIKENK